MAHLWFRGDEQLWTAAPLGGRVIDLSRLPPVPVEDSAGSGSHTLAPALGKNADSREWVLLEAGSGEIRVNGVRVLAGIKVLHDRDEIRLDPRTVLFYSTESLARAGEFVGAGREIFCGRCRQALKQGQASVRCPSCGIWYHQTAELPCWTYAGTCAFCPQATALDSGFQWVPED